MGSAFSVISSILPFTTIPIQTNQTKTVTADVLSNLRLFAEYSAVAYCPESSFNSTNVSTVCPSSVCPILQDSSIEIANSFIDVGDHQTTVLVMLDHNRQAIAISFRGTTSVVDWQTDLSFAFGNATSICEGCWVHSGFLGSWRGVKDLVLNSWQDWQVRYSAYRTVVTGHSLGGALANLCASELKKLDADANISLYSYGSPRVGNQAFASHTNETFGWNNHRVTHLNDPVPRVPYRINGYMHAGPEYSVTGPHIPNALAANLSTLYKPDNMIVRPSDVIAIPGPENNKGNLGYNCTNPAMHGQYIGPISGCGNHNLVLEGESLS